MRLTKCEGCGFAEPMGEEDKVLPVKIEIGSSSNKIYLEIHQADLCDSCTGLLLHNYFSRPARGQLEVPGFLEPTLNERGK